MQTLCFSGVDLGGVSQWVPSPWLVASPQREQCLQLHNHCTAHWFSFLITCALAPAALSSSGFCPNSFQEGQISSRQDRQGCVYTSNHSFHLNAQAVSGRLNARFDFDRCLWCPFTFSKLVKAFNFSYDHEFSYNNEFKSHSPVHKTDQDKGTDKRPTCYSPQPIVSCSAEGQNCTSQSSSSLLSRTSLGPAAPLSWSIREEQDGGYGTRCGHMYQRRTSQRSHMWVGAALQGLITVFPCEASASCDLYQLFDQTDFSERSRFIAALEIWLRPLIQTGLSNYSWSLFFTRLLLKQRNKFSNHSFNVTLEKLVPRAMVSDR